MSDLKTTTNRGDEMNGWTIGKALPSEVERAANAYNDYTRQAKDAPHKWGEEQEAESARLASVLQELYEKHNIADFDRIV